jgi:hypothetical protein
MGVQNVLDAGDGSGDHHEFVFLNCTANKALVGKDQDGIGAPYNTGCLSSASDKTNFCRSARKNRQKNLKPRCACENKQIDKQIEWICKAQTIINGVHTT